MSLGCSDRRASGSRYSAPQGTGHRMLSGAQEALPFQPTELLTELSL